MKVEANQSAFKVILGARGTKVQPRLKLTSAKHTPNKEQNMQVTLMQDKSRFAKCNIPRQDHVIYASMTRVE